MKNKKLNLIVAVVTLFVGINNIQARSVSLKNDTDAPITITWENARSKAISKVQPGAIGLIDVKPDKWAGSHYAVRDEKVYVNVDGKSVNPFDAQEINEYVKTLWDDDSKNDPAKFAISFKQDDVDVPNVEITSYFDKAKEWFNDHKGEIAIGAAAAAAAAAGTYYATQDGSQDDEPKVDPPKEAPSQDDMIAGYLAVLELDGSERDTRTIKKAYNKLALQHHPDKGGDEEKFKELNNAYHQLKEMLDF